VFFDAVDPKPEPGDFPAELELRYRLEPQFVAKPTTSDPPVALTVRLPMTTPPHQIPKLVSAGVALSPYVRNPGYSRTDPRRKVVWLEFDRPVDNPNDAYFGRALVYAPDPVLLRGGPDVPQIAEPPLPVEPEPIRVVTPGQSDDRAGINAMQRLNPSDSPTHFMLPLPSGLGEDSPELFGFFTYDLRVGHDVGWSTAQGRFGTSLQVSGVQHPAPSLSCSVIRDSVGIEASAPFANPVYAGRSARPFPPVTEVWILLYTQVAQCDGADHRNVLLGRKPARFTRKPLDDRQALDASFGSANWSNDEVSWLLYALTLEASHALSCLAIETLPGSVPHPDPLGADLGRERMLRTSPLMPVPAICPT
jgi:hypothetical protein